MEANREEAERCVEIARKYLREGNKDKAQKFLSKAEKLCPTQAAQNLRHELENSDEEEEASTMNGSAHGDFQFNSAYFDHYHEKPGPRSRFHASRSQPTFSRGPSEEDDASSSSAGAGSFASARSSSPSKKQKGSGGTHASSSAGTRRSGSAERGGRGGEPQRTTSQPQMGLDYSKDELEAVNRIRHCKDYYEILNVSKDFSESELKKNYRKLALQFHPDKCRAPGATEAFKAIGNSYAILSDKEKRERYDMYGADHPATRRRSGFNEYDYSRGFEGDFTPEEIFNMFFGGGFPSGQVYRRRGPGGSTYYYQRSADHGQDRNGNEGGFGVALQLLPILVLLFLSVASQFFIGEPAYNLHRTNKYTVERYTSDLRVPYYVKGDFLKQYRGNVHRVEQQVEDDYISNLRMGCYRERSQKESLAWRARTYGDSQLWEKAQSMPTPNCDRLNEIYS